MSKELFFAAVVLVSFAASPAFAGCVGAAIGDGCIGIPTPNEHEHFDRGYDDRENYGRHHRHNETVIIKKHHHHDTDED